MLYGSSVALITPMQPTGELDEKRIRLLIEMHITAGTNAIVVNGTTGESPTLNDKERNRIIEIAVETAKGRIPIIAGTGTYSTMETIHRSEEARNLGVNAVLIITPYYNKPTQEGLYEHFKAIAESVSIPIILYNQPSRTSCDLLPETVERLSYLPNIIGLKEGSADAGRIKELVARCGERMDFVSSDDASSLAFMLQGGKGVISVTANVVPKAMREMCAAALARNLNLAGELNTRLMPLHKALGLETNPIPVKWAAAQLGLIEEGIRLPLTPLSDKYHAVVREAMKESGAL